MPGKVEGRNLYSFEIFKILKIRLYNSFNIKYQNLFSFPRQHSDYSFFELKIIFSYRRQFFRRKEIIFNLWTFFFGRIFMSFKIVKLTFIIKYLNHALLN